MKVSLEQIISPLVPEPEPNIFSNCLLSGKQLYMSGMTAGDGKGGILGDGTPYDQSRQCLIKIKNLVEAASCTLDDVVKLTIYLIDIHDRSEFGRARAEFFKGVMPCSTLVGITVLAQPDLVVEVDAVALLHGNSN